MAVSSDRKGTGGKLPRGPHQLTADQVAEDQRKRLIDAMVQLAGERSYAATTVADIINHAKVSRKTFYAHFDEREDLLLKAFGAVSTVAFEEVQAASRRTGGPTRQLEAFMRRLCRVARDSPGTIALSTIEIAGANPVGMELRDRLMDEYGQLINECLGADDTTPPMSSMLARSLAGSLHRTIDAQLRVGHVDRLPALALELARWTRSYHPAPTSFGEENPAHDSSWTGWTCLGGTVGGRAPGTLTLAPEDYRPPSGAKSSSFVHHANRERIFDAVALLNSELGYTMLTAQGIAARADISERAFLAHFKNKDEAFAAAIEVGHMKGQAIVERARESTNDWRKGVNRAVYALFDFLGSEPHFTRMAFVDAPLAGPAMAQRMHEHVSAYARLLLDGAPQRRRPPAVAPEAAAHGLFELAFHHAVHLDANELPQAARAGTYLALAPFLGVTEAAESSA